MTVTPISRPSNTTLDDDRIYDPETHAGRLHVLIMGLICTDDTPQVVEPAEKADVQSWRFPWRALSRASCGSA